jgi:DNA-binding transcriptional LysR family regulator
MERPTLRQLEIFTEVVRAGTFRGAARHLGLSQVAVSDHIRQLERRLGCELFFRATGAKPSLSPAGQVVLQHGRNVLFACDALIAAARSESVASGMPVADLDEDVTPAPVVEVEAPAPVVVEAAPASTPSPELVPVESPVLGYDFEEVVTAEAPEAVVAEAVAPETVPMELGDKLPAIDLPTEKAEPIAPLPVEPEIALPEKETHIRIAGHPAILSRYQDKLVAVEEAYPERPISVDFGRYTDTAIADPLATGAIDIALFYALGDRLLPGSDYLWSEQWSLLVRADHPLALRDAVTRAECVDMPVIMLSADNPLRAFSEACLAEAGLWPAPTMLETDDYGQIAAELDHGEAFFPTFGVTAAQFAARAGLKRIALIEPIRPVEIRIALSAGAAEDPMISALAGLLR